MQFGTPEDEVSAVDWDTFKRVCKANPEWKKMWFAKHNARIRPVKYNLVRRKHDDDPTCPCCGALETTDHTFEWDEAKMEEAFITHIAELESHLRATPSKAISDSIMETCRSIHYSKEHTLADNWDEELASTVTNQILLGQRAFIGGLWPKKWLELQRQYHTRTQNSSKSPKVWMSKTIEHTQTLFYHMWKIRNKALNKDEDSYRVR